jgi:hypothetical protein
MTTYFFPESSSQAMKWFSTLIYDFPTRTKHLFVKISCLRSGSTISLLSLGPIVEKKDFVPLYFAFEFVNPLGIGVKMCGEILKNKSKEWSKG